MVLKTPKTIASNFSEVMANFCSSTVPGKHSVPFKAIVACLKGKLDGNSQQLVFHIETLATSN